MKKCRPIIILALKMMGTLLLSAVLGYFLLVAILSMPVNNQVVASYREYSGLMGWNPNVNNRYTSYLTFFDSFEPGVLDDQTDSIIISKSLYDNPAESVFYTAAYMQQYGRYWHGYIAILRPVFYFFSVWDTYFINSIMQIAVAFALCLIVYKETGKLRYPLAVLSSYLLLAPMALMSSFQFSPVFYISFLASIFLLTNKRIKENSDKLYIFFMCVGIITSYIDFLTYPLLAWAMPLCLFIVCQKNPMDLWTGLKKIIGTAVSWTVGYVGMFLSKWVILYLVCGKEAYVDCYTGEAFDALRGLSDDLKVTKEVFNRFEVLTTNWRHYLYAGYILIISLWIIWGIVNYFRGQLNVESKTALLFIITFSSPAWYIVFNTHTAIHHFFTYRIYGASILAFILAVSISVTEEKRVTDFRKKAVSAGLLLVFLLVGIFTSSIAKENVYVLFGERAQTIALNEGDLLQVEFKPSFSNIKQYTTCLTLQGESDGEIVYELEKDGAVVYSSSKPLETFEEKAFDSVNVDWKLNPAETYLMNIYIRDNSSGISYAITNEGETPLTEFGCITLNGTDLGDTEPAGGFVYHTTIRSRVSRIFVSLTVAAFLSLMALCLVNIKNIWRKA